VWSLVLGNGFAENIRRHVGRKLNKFAYGSPIPMRRMEGMYREEPENRGNSWLVRELARGS